MEIDLFPVVPSESRLSWAFDLMAAAQRSAVVVADLIPQPAYSFVEADQVVIAIAERTAESLEGLKQRTPLMLLPPPLFSQFAMDFTQPAARDAIEKHLDATQQRFVLLAVTDTRAVVASRSELDMPAQAGPKDCYCKSDRKPVVPGITNGNCPHDYRHRGTVRCR